MHYIRGIEIHLLKGNTFVNSDNVQRTGIIERRQHAPPLMTWCMCLRDASLVYLKFPIFLAKKRKERHYRNDFSFYCSVTSPPISI